MTELSSLSALHIGAREMLERMDNESTAQSGQELVLDSTNEVSFPDYPYRFEALNEQILVSIDLYKSGLECKICKGKKRIVRKEGRETLDEVCPDCKGRGSIIILLNESKKLPQHGVIVSMGAKAKAESGLVIGDRVLFGDHAGTMVATKAGLMFKYMDWYAAKMKIKGAEGLGAFTFIIDESDRTESFE